MSGRKSWEVANVLKEVDKAQDEIVKNYQSSIESNIEVVRDIEREIIDGEIERKIEALKDEKLREEFRDYKSFFNEANNIIEEFNRVIEKRDNLIKQAKDIRERIKNKTHYATQEYNEAIEIRKKINECKDKLNSLKEESEKLKHQAMKFRSLVENVEDIFEAKKEFLEGMYEDVENKLYSKDYILLEDLVEGVNKKVSKIEYFDHYKNTNEFEKIKEELKNIEILIENNKFDEAENKLNALNDYINKISLEADKIKEDIESSFALSLKIRDIMLEKAGFKKARIDLINNNPINGFKIHIQNGDMIDFEKVKIENGKPVIDLNHIEREAGGCEVKWEELQDIFKKEGIPLTDVKKHGYSVIYRGGAKMRANGKVKEKGKK